MRRPLIPTLLLTTLAVAGCARDLILDLGKGDSIRLAGQSESFNCDDPRFASTKKIRTTELRFADGSSMWLCMTPEDLKAAQKQSAPPIPTTSDARRIVAAPPPTKRPAFKPSVPDDNTKPIVHAVGIYRPEYGVRNEVAVDISDDSRPLILSLSAYEKTHWTLKVQEGVKIEKILLSGYHVQTISGMAPDVPIEVYTYDASPCSQCTRGNGFFFSYDYPHKRIEELTDQPVNTFQGSYVGNRFSITEIKP